MKINIDETVFNKTIKESKLEVAEWLLDKNCPTAPTCYLQNMNISIFNWLTSKGISVDKTCLNQVVEKTEENEIIKWFIQNGVTVDSSCINSCINLRKIELLRWFIEDYSVTLNVDNFIKAILVQDLEILDYLKEKNCPYSESVVENALKYGKKESIKWLVNNGYF